MYLLHVSPGQHRQDNQSETAFLQARRGLDAVAIGSDEQWKKGRAPGPAIVLLWFGIAETTCRRFFFELALMNGAAFE